MAAPTTTTTTPAKPEAGKKSRKERKHVPHGTVTVTLMRFRDRFKKRLAEALAQGELP